MRNDYKVVGINVREMLSSSHFTFLLLLLVLITITGLLSVSTTNSYIDHLISVFSNPFYIVLLLLVFLICSVYTLKQYETHYFYFLRFSGNKQYLRVLCSTVFINHFIIFIVNLLFLMIVKNIFSDSPIEITIIDVYKISNLSYSLFYLLRLFLLTLIVSLTNVLLMKLVPYFGVIICNIILWGILFAFPAILPTFLSNFFSTSFFLEVLWSCLSIILQISFLILIYQLALRKIKRIGEV